MKRSTQLALVAMAGVAVLGYFWLSQTEAETEGTVYASMDDCLYAGTDAATCKARFEEATDTYKKTAPRFVSLQDCERDFGAGACTPATAPVVPGSGTSVAVPGAETTTTAANPGSQSYFMPMMMGFMAARMMGGGMQQSYTASPLYGCGGAASGAGGRCYTGASGRSYYGNAGSRTVTAPVSEFRSASANRGFSVVPRGSSATSAAVSSRGGFGGSSRSYSGTTSGG